jgi:hypothetical protein
MIAIARKVIILEVGEIQSLTLIGIEFIIASLSAGYYLVKKSQEETICKILASATSRESAASRMKESKSLRAHTDVCSGHANYEYVRNGTVFVYSHY